MNSSTIRELTSDDLDLVSGGVVIGANLSIICAIMSIVAASMTSTPTTSAESVEPWNAPPASILPRRTAP